MSVRIKVCGVLSADAAAAAADAGADLVGLNFVPSSPRCLSLAVAEEIAERLADTEVERVAVFQDAPWHEIERVTRRIDLERIQFHGSESEEDVELVDYPVIKALRGADREAMEKYPGALLLLDNPTHGGGQGAAWNWSEAAELIAEGWDVILAGGLNPDNVGEALDGLGDLPPWGVDVATGVEGSDHRKDPAKMAAFVKAVRAAEGGGA
ncbi:MAG: phosphoribosylanthranilate isomerase [Myxococcota bacterium]|nr:phosphoribosylanthranilate isomerase [Myxococcota bacterium]